MVRYDDRRRAQIAAMADPDRLELLALILGSDTEVTVAGLAGPGGDGDRFAAHLTVMAQVGLLIVDGERYRPSADALARFGGSAVGHTTAPTAGVDPGDHGRLLRRIAEDLARECADHFAPETIAEFVMDSYQLLASRATVRVHLPALTARFAAERLTALVQAADADHDFRRDVLFVCVRNAGRSQIAAALMRSVAGDRLRVRTAGSLPAARVDPVVRSELVRRGVAGLTEFPRPLTSEVVRASGVVVTMGCGDACPVVPGRRYVDWQVADPVGRPAGEVRRIVEDISTRVLGLVRELDAS